ncbi:MAG: hypothetical protein KJO76_02610 [Gammaproteobacteria bacterium]|nr:hypothetical protein [Gammaproteobacteria bacterium]NND37051.1 hypothetical protein [Gammaproteobacteria bacterium]
MFGLALLEQVLLDYPGVGNFDSSPILTFGCNNTLACYMLVPYGVSGSEVINVTAVNRWGGSAQGDEIADPLQTDLNGDLGDVTLRVYADFQFEAIQGDVDDDGELSVSDLVITARCIGPWGGMIANPLCSDWGKRRVDLYPVNSGDGVIDVSDILLLQRAFVASPIPPTN